MNSNDFYKSKYSKYKNKYLELKQKNLKFNQEGGMFESGKYLFYIINSEFIKNKYKIEYGPFVKKDGRIINDFEELKKLSILIIPLDKETQFTYKNLDNKYIDHHIISSFKSVNLINNSDEFFKKATDQIPFYKLIIEKYIKSKLEEDEKLDRTLQLQIDVEKENIKKCENGIVHYEKNIINLKAVKQDFEVKIEKLNENIREEKKKYEVIKGTEDKVKIAELQLNIQSYNQQITDIKGTFEYFNNQNNIDNSHKSIKRLEEKIEECNNKIIKLELQKDNKEKLILRLTFEFNKLSSNKLLDTFRFTP